MKKLILSLFSLFILLLGCKERKLEEQPPNIILILADDFGYTDIQAYAKKLTGEDRDKMFYETPNLDRLMDEGVSFSYAYANQLCSPTRASILTGKYAARVGFTTATPLRDTYYNQNMEVPEGSYAHDVLHHYDNIDIEYAWINAKSNTALPAGTIYDDGRDELTIAEALEEYNSAFIGKWHIGGHGAEGYQPSDQGFNPINWFDAGGSTYFNWRDHWNNKSKSHFPDMPQEKWEIGDAGEETGEEYLTDDLTVQALRFLDNQASQKDGKPFFLYFCHFAVHGPWEAKKEDSIYFAGKSTLGWKGHDKPEYAGMVKALDNSVGSILDKLEETGLEDNTLVIFYSDNGGWDSRVTRSGLATDNSPLLGGKACLTEGGIRVPLIFKWKGKVEEGKWCDVSVDCSDLFPTILEAAGHDPQKYYAELDIDGRSLMPLLSDRANSNKEYDHNTRYFHYPFNVSVYSPIDGFYLTPRSAILKDPYKLIFDWHGRLYLFNVREDISETNNLARQMPDKTRELFADLVNWMEEYVEDQYWPKLNPEYDASNEARANAPFVNLYEAYKNGEDILNLIPK